MTLRVAYGGVPHLFQEREFTAASFAEAVNHFVSIGEAVAVRELQGLGSHYSGSNFMRGSLVNDQIGWLCSNERVGWMCRVLFEPKDAEPLRPPRFGGLLLPDHTMPLKSWPRYPVALSGTTYFVLSEGLSMSGIPEDPGAYIEYCLTNGVFRTGKVTVPTRLQALADAVVLRNSKAWAAIKWKDSGENWSYTMNERWIWDFIQGQAERIR